MPKCTVKQNDNHISSKEYARYMERTWRQIHHLLSRMLTSLRILCSFFFFAVHQNFVLHFTQTVNQFILSISGCLTDLRLFDIIIIIYTDTSNLVNCLILISYMCIIQLHRLLMVVKCMGGSYCYSNSVVNLSF